MAAPTHGAPPPSGPAAPPPPPPPPPAVVKPQAVGSDVLSGRATENAGDEEEHEFLLNALDVAGDWSAHDDGDGRLFYYNRRTRASQWAAPEGFLGLEGELMMALMLEGAVARSGHWTAHAAGDGSAALFYFNAKTRESVWERPSDWGVLPPPPPKPEKPSKGDLTESTETVSQVTEHEDADESEKRVKKDKKKKKRRTTSKEGARHVQDQHGSDGGAQEQARASEAPKEEEGKEEEEEEDPEELEAAKRREEAHMKHIAQFRAMLREKNIMPFCRWSVALPQIAGDTRFMGISTMDERREIFEHFVKHRRENLKAEKKQKLQQAKKLFEELLADQFKDRRVDAKTTLGVFLATLEDHVDAARYKLLQDESLAYLTIDAQEKLFTKAMSEFQAEEVKKDEETKRLAVFLEKEMATEVLSWDDPKAKGLVEAFHASDESSTTGARLLSTEKQQQVFLDVAQRLRAAQDSALSTPIRSDDDGRRRQVREEPSSHGEDRQRRDRYRGRSSSRSRSHSRRRASRRDRSEESDRRHRHTSRSSRQASRSPSRSRSRSRRRHRHARHSRRSPSSSWSRSRSHSCHRR